MPRSSRKGRWRATGGNDGARTKYTTLPKMMASKVWRKSVSTDGLDTIGGSSDTLYLRGFPSVCKNFRKTIWTRGRNGAPLRVHALASRKVPDTADIVIASSVAAASDPPCRDVNGVS